ncbi:hypothetical protein FRA_47c13400 [Francisella sp. W12-1067]|nr:hypothetical protein FRA_47c13400 [Francisella sp. W12-1067]
MKLTPSQYVIKTISSYDNNDPRYMEYTRLYLDGLSTNALNQFIIRQDNVLNNLTNTEQYLKFFKKNNLQFDPVRINDDPTRRYFETHLCCETLFHHLSYLTLSDLNSLYAAAIKFGGPAVKEHHEKTLSQGEYLHIGSEGILGQGPNIGMPKDFLSKCQVLCKLGAYATDVAKNSGELLPHDIYSTAKLYQEHYRARDIRPERKTLYNRNLGLMRTEMPIPRNDLATSLRPQTYKRPTDNSNPMLIEGDNWPNKVFSLHVLPYANSPSGTMLCQLRLIIALMERGTLPNIDYNNYLRCFIAAMLYGSGGHTLYEFVVPLTLDELSKDLSPIIKVNSVSDLFYINNETACNIAMKRTISYNKYYCKLIGMDLGIQIKKARVSIDNRMKLKAAEEKSKMALLLQEKQNKILTFDLVTGVAKLENKPQSTIIKNKLQLLKEINESGVIDWPVGTPGENKLLYKKRLTEHYCSIKQIEANKAISDALDECIIAPK